MKLKQISNWNKFCLLMWKNILLQWRHKVQTIIEIIVPIMLCLGIFVIRSLVTPVEIKNDTYFKPIDQDATEETLSRPFENDVIGFTPDNEHLDDMTHGVTWYMHHNITYRAAANKQELETLIEDKSIIAGIVYHHPANITECPKNLNYTLIFPSEWGFSPQFFYNWQRNPLFSIYSGDGPGKERRNDSGFPSYFQEAFASIQSAMAHYFFIVHCYKTVDECHWADDTEFPRVTVQRLPALPHSFDNLLEALQILVSLSVMLSLIYPTMNTVRFIVMEKERQLKHAMKMMGIPRWIQWLSWFVRTMILMMIIISFMVGLLKMSVFVHSDLTTIWAFLFTYSISMTTYCFMLSAFFSEANCAAGVAALFWVISYIPISFIYRKSSEEMFLASKIIASLCSNTEMGYGVQIILRFEETGEGLQWSNFLKPVTNDDDISIGVTMAFMLTTSCVYLLVALFVKKIYSSTFGILEKWYVRFTKQFWCRKKSGDIDEDCSEVSFNDNRNNNNLEVDSENRSATVRIEKLRKIFGEKRAKSRGLSLNLFEDQITVLLGSGKTTIISMLTGMLPPTSGIAIINGYDIQKYHVEARDRIGFCPQHNMLYDQLTVREHITFYSRLKGMSCKGGKEEVKKYVELLKLEPEMNAMPSSLTRGSQRKLSVALALCAQSKVVFLDEPSNGMDPCDRRVLWDVLENEKKGRTILLTTHSMNEADMLGDKIVIVKDGELDDLDASSLLKNRFNVVYNLSCVKEADCNLKSLTFTLRNFIPKIKLKSEIGNEIIFELPKGQTYRFEKLLKYLETDGSRLKLSSFGIWSSEDAAFSITDLTERRIISSTSHTENNETFKKHELLRGLRLELHQCHAMLKKKYIFWYRNWILFIWQFLISVTFIMISIVIFHIIDIDTQLEPVNVSLDAYKKSVTMLQNENLSIPYAFNYTGVMASYREIIQERHAAHTVDEFDEDIQSRFLRLAKTVRLNIGLNSQYLVGMSSGDNITVIGWFNNQPFNTVPLTISLIHNAIVRSKYGSNFSISLTQEPLPFTIKSRVHNLLSGNNLGFQLATFISFAMAILSALYAIFYIKERVPGIKQLQFISGVRTSTLWLISFLFDYLMYVSTVVVMISTILVFQEDGWSTFDELLPAFVILVVFGFAILPITYVFAWFFSLISTAIVGLTIIYLFTGAILFFMVAMLSLPFIVGAMGPFKDYLVIFPHYSLSTSLNNLNLMNMVKRLCQIKCSRISADVCDQKKLCSLEENCCERNYYACNEPGIGRSLTYMYVNGLTFFIALLFVEYGGLKTLIQLVAYYLRIIFIKQSHSEEELVDSDVTEEKRKVDAMRSDDLEANNLVVRNVSKFYGKTLVVDQVSIGINPSECFGLFGVSRSGKTTILEMLTGGTDISSGAAFVRGISIETIMSNAQKMIGYCPQSDALFEELTGRETLEIFALMRGVRTKDIKNLINCLANDLNFTQQIDQKVSEYSTGNKRKLSISVALIGKPEVIYLDEPTRGMDQDSRQSLMNTIVKICNYGKSIVLASNNLEDHTACSRMAILVKGTLKCLGTTAQLKNKFSEGFLFTMKVSSQSQDVKDEIQSKFPTAKLKREHDNFLMYYMLPGREFKGSSNFALMESLKKSHLIEDYTICQPFLEQVFSSFT